MKVTNEIIHSQQQEEMNVGRLNELLGQLDIQIVHMEFKRINPTFKEIFFTVKKGTGSRSVRFKIMDVDLTKYLFAYLKKLLRWKHQKK